MWPIRAAGFSIILLFQAPTIQADEQLEGPLFEREGLLCILQTVDTYLPTDESVLLIYLDDCGEKARTDEELASKSTNWLVPTLDKKQRSEQTPTRVLVVTPERLKCLGEKLSDIEQLSGGRKDMIVLPNRICANGE